MNSAEGERSEDGGVELERSLTVDLFLFVAACVGMIAFQVWQARGEPVVWGLLPAESLGIFVGLLFIAAVMAGKRLFFGPRIRLILTADGLIDRTPLVGGELFIPWKEIAAIYPGSFGRISVELKDPARMERRAGSVRWWSMRIQRAFGRPSVLLFTLALKRSRAEVLRILAEHADGVEVEGPHDYLPGSTRGAAAG